MTQSTNSKFDTIEAPRERAEKAETENAALLVDAERYRWLRTESKPAWEKIGELSLARDVDAAIDAARKV